jgi:hypothetical protein
MPCCLILEKIRQVIGSDPMVIEVNWVTGRYRFLESGLALGAISRRKMENAVRRIETTMRDMIPNLERLLVQVESARAPLFVVRSLSRLLTDRSAGILVKRPISPL